MIKLEDKINVGQFLSRFLRGGKTLASGELSANCIFHHDEHASLSVNLQTGQWKCFVPTCRGFAGGNLVQFIALLRNIPTDEAYKWIANECGVELEPIKRPPPELSEEKVLEYHQALLNDRETLTFLLTKYLWKLEIIQYFKLGLCFTGPEKRISIPIYDEKNILVNIRKKPLTSGKCIGIEFWNQMRLFPIMHLEGETVYLFEGEKDCILACQLGLNAMTVTSGAGAFSQEWIPYFKDKSLVVCYDIDEAGIAGAIKLKEFLLHVTRDLKIVGLPIKKPANGDFTDYILQGGTAEEFLKLVDKTASEEKILTQKTRITDHVYTVGLAEAANAQYYFKRVCFNIIISGKDTQPFLPPKEIEISCPMGQVFCKYCGIAPYGGKFVLKMNHLSADVLQWIDCTEEHHNVLIRKNMEIPMRCKIWKSFVKEAQTVEEVTLIPEIDYAMTGDTEYVVRSAYVIGKSVKSNHNYKLEAVTLPHPLTQAATHLIYAIAENRTAIDEFRMTEELCKKLRIFNVGKSNAS